MKDCCRKELNYLLSEVCSNVDHGMLGIGAMVFSLGFIDTEDMHQRHVKNQMINSWVAAGGMCQKCKLEKHAEVMKEIAERK